MRPGLIAALLGCLLVVAGAPVAVADDGEALSQDRADRRLDRALESLVDRQDGPPGVIAVIQRGNSRTIHRAGVKRIGSGAPLRIGERMRIASTSKAMSGATVLSLVDSGAISLEDTIGGLLPDQPAAWREVTLRQLLNHTSGLPDFTASRGFVEALLGAPHDPVSPAELLGFVADRDLGFAPGTDYAYSNSDNVVVGLMVEAVTGDSYADRLHGLVAAQLGLGRTALGPAPTLARPFIHGYDTDPPGRPEDVSDLFDFGGWAWASGGIVSTPGNLGRFIRAYVGGDLIGGSTRSASRCDSLPGASSEPRGPGQNSAGLALFRYRTSCGTVFGHTGSITGYTQLMAANRSGSRSLTFTINAQASRALLPQLRAAQKRAVCAALARGRR